MQFWIYVGICLFHHSVNCTALSPPDLVTSVCLLEDFISQLDRGKFKESNFAFIKWATIQTNSKF